MTQSDKIFNQLIEGFNKNRGRGSTYVLPPINAIYLIARCLIQYNKKHPDGKILIIADDYGIKKGIDTYLYKFDAKIEYKVLTQNYFNFSCHYNYDFTIFIGLNIHEVTQLRIVKTASNFSKFALCFLTEHIYAQERIQELRNFLPNIPLIIDEKELEYERIYSPVEEHHIGVDLSTDTANEYNKYNDFIIQSTKIFGTLDNIHKCKYGIPEQNISSAIFRNNLAIENGWSPELDTNIEFNRKIDEIYNPNILFERATTFFNIANLRRSLLHNNIDKLETILNICKDNPDKKILIVSKSGKFAAAINNYINENSDIRCVEYHDEIEEAMAVDDMGNVITYKSGENKGKPRMLKSKAISTINLRQFNIKQASVLSIKYASDSSIKTTADIVIFSYVHNETITDFKIRYSNINYSANPLLVYIVYCNNTLEQQKLSLMKQTQNVRVLWDNEKNVIFDEKSGDIIL